MKALTVRQPWASLIVAGVKDVENRSRNTRHRGPLAIHVAQTRAADGSERGWQEFRRLNLDLQLGEVIGVVDLYDVVRDSPSKWAIPDSFHWLLRHPRRVKPVPLRGRLGLWDMDDSPLRPVRGGKPGK
jgi:hypothetical protein